MREAVILRAFCNFGSMTAFFRFASLLLLLLSPQLLQAQLQLSGKVLNQKGENLVGAQILVAPASGTITDSRGEFSIRLPAGEQRISVHYLGFETKLMRLRLQSDTQVVWTLNELDVELRQITITGSRLARETLRDINAVDILPARFIQNSNAVRVFEAIDKVPGITVVDGQINLRNGSGFSYGAGTRTLFVVDDQPLITADRNDIRWNFLPSEMIDQIEVSKGASSAIYGSGALNGVIHLRTFWPEGKYETRIQTFYQHIGQPAAEYQAWWGERSPFERGVALAHGQRIGQLEVVAGVNIIDTRSYIEASDQYQNRYTLKARWKPKKVKGLTLQVSSSWMESSEADYIVWNDADSGAFVPLRSTTPGRYDGVVRIERRQFHVSPEVLYKTAKGAEHFLQSRWYQLSFLNFSQNLVTDLYSVNYRYTQPLGKYFKVVSGINRQNFGVTDPLGVGNRQGYSQAAFGQLFYRNARLSAEVGLRYEQFQVLNLPLRQAPFVKAGVNYVVSKNSSVRLSTGQGYRFPSIAEMFVNRPNDRLKIYPNPSLRPEYGWTTEIGYKQLFRIGDWQLAADFSLFQMDFYDVVVFQLDNFLPDSITNPTPIDYINYIGFQMRNLSRARIGGLEASLSSQGKIGQVAVYMLAGYTYTYPIDLNGNDSLRNLGRYWGRLFGSMFRSELNQFTEPVLKYRNRHLVKLDVEAEYKGFLVGVDYRYYSKIESVDSLFFGFIPELWDYVQSRSGNEFQFNMRLGYNAGKYGQFTLIGNNLLNRFYTLRFARAEPPRNVVIQYRLTIR